MVTCSERKKVAFSVSLAGFLACCTIALTILVILQQRNYDELSARKRIVDTAKVLVSSNLLSHMNPNENPCDNFFEYTTGNFAEKAFVDVYKKRKFGTHHNREELQGFVPRLLLKIKESEKSCQYEKKMATIFDSCITSTKSGGIEASEIARFVVDWYRNETGFSLDLLQNEADLESQKFETFPSFYDIPLRVSTLFFSFENNDGVISILDDYDQKSKLPVEKKAQTILIDAVKSIFNFDEDFEAKLAQNLSMAVEEYLQVTDYEMLSCCNGTCFRNNETSIHQDFNTTETSADNNTCSEIVKSKVLEKIEAKIPETFRSQNISSVEFGEYANSDYLYNLNSDRCFNDPICFHIIHLFSLLHRSFVSSNLDYHKQFELGNDVTNCVLQLVEMPMFESLLANSFMRHYSGKEAYVTMDDMYENVKNSFLAILDNISHDDTKEDIKKFISDIYMEPTIEDYLCAFNDATLDKLQLDTEENSTFLDSQKKVDQFLKTRLGQGDWDLTGFLGGFYINAMYLEDERKSVIFSFLISDFYTQANPVPINYGYIGCIVGHEIGHSIDPNLFVEMYSEHYNNTLDNVTNSNYQKFASCLIEIFDNVGINGSRTVGENFSDLFGTIAAFRAMKKKLAESDSVTNFDEYPGLNQFTPEQLFFISMAQGFRLAYLDGSREKLPEKTYRGAHAPNWARVNVLLSLVPEFAEAFSCVPGDRMVLSHDCGLLWL